MFANMNKLILAYDPKLVRSEECELALRRFVKRVKITRPNPCIWIEFGWECSEDMLHEVSLGPT